MWKQIRSLSLTTWIFVALIVGMVIGTWLPDVAHLIKPLRIVFLNGVKSIIAPLIFGSIVTGINSSSGLKALGRTGFRAILWFEIATTLALLIGLFFVNYFGPGYGMKITGHLSADVAQAARTEITISGFIEHLVPSNIAEAIAKGDVLQIVIFSSIFGVAVLMTGERGRPVMHFCESLNFVMFKFTEIVMSFAPIGVGAAIAGAIAEHGLEVLLPMAKLVGTLYLALIVFVLVVLLPALKFAGVNIKKFFRAIRPSLTLAFATTSSESAFPSALQLLERMGVPKRISSFVLPLGYSFNLDGSTLYLSVAAVFLAQASGVELTFERQITMMLMLMVTTKGIAAVPRTSIVVLSATLVTFGIPLEGLVLIMGVDEFMDMARTAVNLLGNCVATLVVARTENEPLNPDYS